MKQDFAFDSIRHEEPRDPQLAVPWPDWREQLRSSVLVLLRGPTAPKIFSGDPFFRDCWIERRAPKLAFAAAIAVQALLVAFPPPIWNIRPPHDKAPSSQMELTWYGPPKDFPVILPRLRAPRPMRHGPTDTPVRRGADAFHPRQTIISEPLHPTHPRQTLLQPSAPPEPPKILPQLPNIVRLAESEPARPKLQVSPKQLAAMRPKDPTPRTPQDAAVPEVVTPEKQMGAINIASSLSSRPAVPITPMSVPVAPHQRDVANVAMPEIAQQTTGDRETLIALSATPAPVAPPPVAPAGNLSARISVSPEGTQPGASAAARNLDGGSTSEGGGKGPEGIFISGANNPNSASGSGLGIGSASRSSNSSLPSRPMPRAAIPSLPSRTIPSDSASSHSGSTINAPREEMLRGKQVYTLNVNMPNLTSATGSWVLNFAELDENDSKLVDANLSGPIPVRKVDPKYPPELRTKRVEGEVVLYAIIRKDGTVDSIQLVHGVDPLLDQNAMEALAQWKFRPGEKQGAPIDLEAVVHIPYHFRAPVYPY